MIVWVIHFYLFCIGGPFLCISSGAYILRDFSILGVLFAFQILGNLHDAA